MIDLFDFVVLSSFMILLPLVTDFLNNTFPNAKIGRLAQEVVGMILVFFIVSLIFSGVSLWYTHFLPFYFTKSLLVSFKTLNLLDLLNFIDNGSNSFFNKIVFYFHIFFTIQLVINLYYYYYQTITADNFLPKISKKKQIQLSYDNNQTTNDDDNNKNNNNNNNKLCGLCDQVSDGKWSTINKIKSHHCRICKRCVDSMDHHCPFAANCIGINNHHYFILFIIYTVLGLLYATYLSFFPYYYCILNYKDYQIENNANYNNQLAQSCRNFNKYSFIFLCCCLIVIASFGILLFQSYLIITNSKTIQLLSGLKKSKSFLDWFKWLYQNFKKNASINNIYSLFPNFKFYNLIIPYYKRR